VILTPLPEPATEPGPATPRPRLYEDRHIPAHRNLVIFTSTDGSNHHDR
jgi:hypothetical protein